MGSVTRLRLVTVGDKFADDLLTLGVQLSITHVATVAPQAEYRGSSLALATPAYRRRRPLPCVLGTKKGAPPAGTP